jgi:hypothetical protein
VKRPILVLLAAALLNIGAAGIAPAWAAPPQSSTAAVANPAHHHHHHHHHRHHRHDEGDEDEAPCRGVIVVCL